MKNVENETQKLFYLDYGKKTEIRAKRETHTIKPGICRETGIQAGRGGDTHQPPHGPGGLSGRGV